MLAANLMCDAPAAGSSEYDDVIAEVVDDRNTIVVRYSMSDLEIPVASKRFHRSGSGYRTSSMRAAQ